MYEKMVLDLAGGRKDFGGALFRYGVLDRLARIAKSHQVQIIAFGFTRSEIRLVLCGESASAVEVARGLKVGTARASLRWGLSLHARPSEREPIAASALRAAVCWAHRAPVEAGALEALASPWSSLRDALGYRRAEFFDPTHLRGLVRREDLMGDEERLPAAWYPPVKEDLATLLRVSAAVRGVLPASHRCSRLFVHTALDRGFDKPKIAAALAVTVRRVRQLASEPEPDLPIALAVLADRCLAKVP